MMSIVRYRYLRRHDYSVVDNNYDRLTFQTTSEFLKESTDRDMRTYSGPYMLSIFIDTEIGCSHTFLPSCDPTSGKYRERDIQRHVTLPVRKEGALLMLPISSSSLLSK